MWQKKFPNKPGVYWVFISTAKDRGYTDLVELRQVNHGVFQDFQYDMYELGNPESLDYSEETLKQAWWWALNPPPPPLESSDVAERNT